MFKISKSKIFNPLYYDLNEQQYLKVDSTKQKLNPAIHKQNKKKNKSQRKFEAQAKQYKQIFMIHPTIDIEKFVPKCCYSESLKNPRSINLINIHQQETNSELLYVQSNGNRYLIDTGSQISIVPKSQNDQKYNFDFVILSASNTPIRPHGLRSIELQLGSSTYKWTFITTEIDQRVMGIDMLRYFGIMVDPKNNRLLDQNMRSITAESIRTKSMKLTCIKAKHPLQNYPELIDHSKINKEHTIYHKIITNNVTPRVAPVYNYSPSIEQQLVKHFEELMEQGICRRSSSRWTSPLAVIVKKDKSLRVCGDYRWLNSITVNDGYSLPYLQSFNNYMRGSKLFSKIDIHKAFYQIPMDRESIPKTAVQTPIGLLEFIYMPFGLKTAAQTWQRYIDSILKIYYKFSFTFMDDIIIHSENENKHSEHLNIILEQLKANNLKVNQNKCEFFSNQITFLGYKVTPQGIEPTAEKVEAILNWQIPVDHKQLKSFLCTVNFYHKFIPNLADTTLPLMQIKQTTKSKKEKIKLSQDQIDAFNRVKQALAKATTLNHPDPQATLIIETDSSTYAMGSVLNQLTVEKTIEPLFFFSRKYAASQLHLDPYRKELIALYATIKRLNKYLLCRPVIAYTDNSTVFHKLRNIRDETDQFSLRRLIYINQFINEIHLISTARNYIADALSRDIVRTNVIELFKKSQISIVRIANEQTTDEWCSKLEQCTDYVKKLQTVNNTTCLIWFKKIEDEKFLICVPKKSVERVIGSIHNTVHLGVTKTVLAIKQKYFWPTMYKDIRNYIKYCTICQQQKHNRMPYLPVKLIEQPDSRFTIIHMDIMGPLPETVTGYKYILSIKDRFTKYIVLINLKSITSASILEAFIEHYLTNYGTPQIIITDNATNFKAETVEYFVQKLGIKHKYSTAYFPRSNGFIESPNKVIKQSIRCILNQVIQNKLKLKHTPQWSNAVPFIQLMLNNSNSESEIYTPAQMVFGTSQKLPFDLIQQSIDVQQQLNVWSEPVIQDFILIMNSLSPAQINHHNKYQPKTFVYKDLASCESVWVKHEARDNKLDACYKGPYKVLKREKEYFLVQTDRQQPVKYNLSKLKPTYTISNLDCKQT